MGPLMRNERTSSQRQSTSSNSKPPTFGTTVTRKQAELSSPLNWIKVVDVRGVHPGHLVVLLNPKYRVVLIKSKDKKLSPCKKPLWLDEEETCSGESLQNGKLILHVPHAVDLKHLEVKSDALLGHLILKAPISENEKYEVAPSIWIPVSVDLEGNEAELLGKKLAPSQSLKPTKETPALDEKKSKCLEKEEIPFSTSSIHKLFGPQFIKDKVTGKLAMLITVNTVGFPRQFIHVQVMEKEQILIVEAQNTEKSSSNVLPIEKQLLNGLPMSRLRYEFVIPGYVDKYQIAYQVLRNGLLSIKLPLLQTRGHYSRGLDVVDEKWEKL